MADGGAGREERRLPASPQHVTQAGNGTRSGERGDAELRLILPCKYCYLYIL